jgi:tetratricopeptide (TPR) repeat protein
MLVAPRCAQERDLDIEEVHHMRDEDEPDVARDELLFLVEDCRGFLEAYNLLAELAIEDGDIPLARGHFGFGYESVLEALPHGFRGVLPSREGYNPHFYLAGRGLARCLIAMQQPDKAREVLKRLLELDPTEPDVRALLEDLESGGAAAAPSSAPPAT